MSQSDRSPVTRRSRRYTHGPHIYERNGRYYLHIPPARKGQAPERRALNTSDRAEAERRLGEYLAGGSSREAERAQREAQAEREAQAVDLAAIVEAYVTAPHGWSPRARASARARATAFLRWCFTLSPPVTHAHQLTGAHAQQWVRDRLSADAAHATINRDLSIIRKMFRWASHRDRALCDETPFARLMMLTEDKRAQAPLIPSPREVRAVVDAIQAQGHQRPPTTRGKTQPRKQTRRDVTHDPRPEARVAALYVVLSLATGARISEIAGLSDSQLHAGAWVVPPSKGHAERTLQLDAGIERAAREFVALLKTARARNYKRITVNERWALDLLTWGCQTAGVPRFKPHDLRRTFATECRRAGLPVPLIRDLMGHKDTMTTERYFGRYREDAAVKVPVPEALRDLMREE